MFVFVSVLSGRDVCDGPITRRQEESTDCGGSECDRGTSQRKPRTTRDVEPRKRDKMRERSQAGGGTEFIRRGS